MAVATAITAAAAVGWGVEGAAGGSVGMAVGAGAGDGESQATTSKNESMITQRPIRRPMAATPVEVENNAHRERNCLLLRPGLYACRVLSQNTPQYKAL